jgi:hypothetical protein
VHQKDANNIIGVGRDESEKRTNEMEWAVSAIADGVTDIGESKCPPIHTYPPYIQQYCDAVWQLS